MEKDNESAGQQDRREFLNTFGKAAVVAPPVITGLLSTSMASPAIAASTGGVTPSGSGGSGGSTKPPKGPHPYGGPARPTHGHNSHHQH
jgi:hypothetical protein